MTAPTGTSPASGPGDGPQIREPRLRALLDALPAAIYMTDAEGRLTHFNAAAVEFSGREPDLRSDRWCVSWKLYHPDGRAMPHEECPMAVALREGRALRGVGAVAERPDGRRIPFEAYPSPLRDDDGRIVGAVNMLIDVGDRASAEEELRRVREDQTDFLENASIAMHWVGPDGTILWANRTELEMLGYAREQYIGRYLGDFHADPAVAEDLLPRLTSAEALDEYPSRLRCRDGSIRHVLINSNPLWRGGEFVHTRCFIRDVTARRDAEEARARLAAVVESSDDAIVGKDLDGIVTAWNRGAERLFGYPPQEAIGRSVKLLIPEDRRDEETQILRRLRRGERVDHYETVRRHRDGRLIDISLTTSPIIDGEGRIVGASKVARDITERKWTERMAAEQVGLLERIAAGAPLDECLEALCAAVPRMSSDVRACILLADDDGRSFARSVAPDHESSFVEALDGSPVDRTACSYAEAVCSGRAATCADIAGDGQWSPAWRDLCLAHGIRACHSEPIPGADGRPVASFVLCFDRPRTPGAGERRLAEFGAHTASIALARERSSRALRESEHHLRELSRSLEERVVERTQELHSQTERLRNLAAELTTAEQRERKRMAAVMHDELQQLLVAARMQLGRGRGRIEDDTAADAVAHAERLLEETVAASRDLTRQLRPPVLYEDGLVSALNWLAAENEERYGLAVSIDADEADQTEEGTLDHDTRALLFECVRELLFNVVRYAGVDEAGVGIDHVADGLRVVVSDCGCGFDPDTVRESGDGGGFGLFSIRERLTALGGRFTVESAEDVGTRVELVMPLSAADADRRAEPPADSGPRAEVGEETGVDDRRARILVVDDHAIVREGIANVLENDERVIIVGEAADGVEAIRMAERHQPDVVLMDVNMPRMNGIEATREVHRQWPHMLTVGLSVHGDALTDRLMRDAGAAGFITKSGDSEEIIATILELVGGSGGPASDAE